MNEQTAICTDTVTFPNFNVCLVLFIWKIVCIARRNQKKQTTIMIEYSSTAPLAKWKGVI